MSARSQDDIQQEGTGGGIPSSSERSPKINVREEPPSATSFSSDFGTTTSHHNIPAGYSTLCPSTSLILQTVEKFKANLPPFWEPIGDKKGIHLYRLSNQIPKRAIQREVFIPYVGNEEIFVHCKPLSFAEKLLKSVEGSKVILTENTIDIFCHRGVSIAKILEQYSVCLGADLLELKDVWGQISNSFIDSNPYQEEKFTETCRTSSCPVLIELGKAKRCLHCKKLLRSLKTRMHALLSKNPHPSTPNIYLTYEQALEKLKLQHDEIKKKDLRIAYLEKRFQDILDKDGVDVDSDVSEDLANILANSNLTTEQEIFFREQFSCFSKADPKAHRWHPYMIRLALHLHMVSRSAYEDLRNTGIIKLPSSRTLYDYSHAFVPEEGISDGSIALAKSKIDKFQKKHQKYVTVFADEMTVSKNLVFRQSDGMLVGFTHLDQVDKEVLEFDKQLSGKGESSKGELASKILAFMIKGCTSDVKYVVASYPCNQLTKDMLYARAWNLISRLERAGIRVLAVVADGCAVNRAFIDMHDPITTTDSGIVFDTLNFCSEDERSLYFISDVAHLLKTIRNCFYNSGDGEKKTRCLEINGEKIVWKTIVRLYMTYKQCNLRKSYKLNSQNVFPNSYSCMKVKFAAEVLSNTVALDLEQQNWPETRETIKFIRLNNKFFDILNGAHSAQHIRTRNPDLAPFKDINDPRFEWLLEVYLNYLQDWESQVRSKNLPLKEQEKMLLSRQTREGIEITIRGFISATKFLLQEGADFVNARTFSQDHLEQHFSLQRAGGGGSSNPNVNQFLSKQVSINIQRDLGIRKRGNVTESGGTVDVHSEPLPKKPRKSAPRKAVRKQ